MRTHTLVRLGLSLGLGLTGFLWLYEGECDATPHEFTQREVRPL